MFFTNFGFNYVPFAAKDQVITGIESSVLKKKYSMPKYRVHKVLVSMF